MPERQSIMHLRRRILPAFFLPWCRFWHAAIKFLTYEQLSRKISHHLIDNGGDGQLTPLLRLSAGAGAWHVPHTSSRRFACAALLPSSATPACSSCWPGPAWAGTVRPCRCMAAGCARSAPSLSPQPSPISGLAPLPCLGGCRAAAGVVGMSATYPLDMVRGRITVQEAGNPQYRGLWHATGCIIRCGS